MNPRAYLFLSAAFAVLFGSCAALYAHAVRFLLTICQRMRPYGGNGFLRLYEFLPEEKKIQARSYSSVWDR